MADANHKIRQVSPSGRPGRGDEDVDRAVQQALAGVVQLQDADV
ncbi:hypothetical protein [Verrucosispora sp. SN26_14.1]|nr:hypothetical protein [Verrucosispora sp. SN26_14.1]